MTISIQLLIFYRRTTDEQSIKFTTKFEEKRARIWSLVSAMWWPGEMKTPACLWHLWSSRDWKCESSIRKRKLQFSSNSSQIDLSSLTHSVPWVVEELDVVDSERYPWFYSGWPPKECIGRTDHFVAGASSDIIFWKDDPIVVFWMFSNHDVFTLFFRNHFLCFLLPFFF